MVREGKHEKGCLSPQREHVSRCIEVLESAIAGNVAAPSSCEDMGKGKASRNSRTEVKRGGGANAVRTTQGAAAGVVKVDKDGKARCLQKTSGAVKVESTPGASGGSRQKRAAGEKLTRMVQAVWEWQCAGSQQPDFGVLQIGEIVECRAFGTRRSGDARWMLRLTAPLNGEHRVWKCDYGGSDNPAIIQWGPNVEDVEVHFCSTLSKNCRVEVMPVSTRTVIIHVDEWRLRHREDIFEKWVPAAFLNENAMGVIPADLPKRVPMDGMECGKTRASGGAAVATAASSNLVVERAPKRGASEPVEEHGGKRGRGVADGLVKDGEVDLSSETETEPVEEPRSPCEGRPGDDDSSTSEVNAPSLSVVWRDGAARRGAPPDVGARIPRGRSRVKHVVDTGRGKERDRPASHDEGTHPGDRGIGETPAVPRLRERQRKHSRDEVRAAHGDVPGKNRPGCKVKRANDPGGSSPRITLMSRDEARAGSLRARDKGNRPSDKHISPRSNSGSPVIKEKSSAQVDESTGEKASGKSVLADETPKPAKQFKDKELKNTAGMGARSSFANCGGTGEIGGAAAVAGSTVTAFEPWWKRKNRKRGKGGEGGQAQKWKGAKE